MMVVLAAFDTDLKQNEGKTYTVVYKATVRDGPDLQARQVGKLKVGDTVVAIHEMDIDGHLRIQIGQDRWASVV